MGYRVKPFEFSNLRVGAVFLDMDDRIWKKVWPDKNLGHNAVKVHVDNRVPAPPNPIGATFAADCPVRRVS